MLETEKLKQVMEIRKQEDNRRVRQRIYQEGIWEPTILDPSRKEKINE